MKNMTYLFCIDMTQKKNRFCDQNVIQCVGAVKMWTLICGYYHLRFIFRTTVVSTGAVILLLMARHVKAELTSFLHILFQVKSFWTIPFFTTILVLSTSLPPTSHITVGLGVPEIYELIDYGILTLYFCLYHLQSN